MKRNFLGLIATSALLGACAYHPVPYESIRPEKPQLNMEAADHWNILAEQVARNIQRNLPANMPSNFAPSPVAADFPTLDSAPLPALDEPLPPLDNMEPIAPVASGNDPLADLPPGTLPPLTSEPTIVELDLSDPNLDLSPSEYQASPMGAMAVSTTPMMPLSNNTATASRPVLYINPPKSGFETPFAYGFHNLLRSHLVQKGVAVTTNPDSVNTHCTNASYCRPMILDYRVDLLEHKDRRHVYEPRTEVIINSAVTDGNLVVFSRSDIFYINPGDQDHYARGTRSLKVVDK